ncbi:MAG: hypothetical protein ACYC6X_00040 [Minisyncoccota bacterium]
MSEKIPPSQKPEARPTSVEIAFEKAKEKRQEELGMFVGNETVVAINKNIQTQPETRIFAEVYGDKAPPKEVLELYQKLPAGKRRSYIDKLKADLAKTKKNSRHRNRKNGKKPQAVETPTQDTFKKIEVAEQEGVDARIAAERAAEGTPTGAVGEEIVFEKINDDPDVKRMLDDIRESTNVNSKKEIDKQIGKLDPDESRRSIHARVEAQEKTRITDQFVLAHPNKARAYAAKWDTLVATYPEIKDLPFMELLSWEEQKAAEEKKDVILPSIDDILTSRDISASFERRSQHTSEQAVAEPDKEAVPHPEDAEEVRGHALSAEEVPVITDRTRKELRDELKKLINEEATREKIERGKNLGMHSKNRLSELDTKAKKVGGVEKWFRKRGEEYNKLPTWQKIALSGSLAFGYGLTLPVSWWLAGAYALPLVATRMAAFMGTFERNHEMLERINEGKARGWFENTKLYEWLGSGSEESREKKAVVKTLLQSFGMTAGLATVAHELAEHNVAERIGQWITEHMSGGVAHPEAPAHIVAPQAAAGEVAAAHAPEMPTVGASSHGYEGMLKQLWSQLQEKHITLPANADHNSDLWKLLNADNAQLDGVVHQIALEHGFAHVGGASALIDPSAHLTVVNGDVHFADATHPDVVHTTGDMDAHVTPPSHPEAVVPPPPPAPIETVPPPVPPIEQIPPPVAVEHAAVPAPDSSVLYDGMGGVVHDSAGNPVHTGAYQPTPEVHAAPEVPPHPPEVDGNFKVNALGLPVDASHATAYLDAQGNKIIFGGSLEERAKEALELVTKDHSAVVYFDSTRPTGPFGLFSTHHISKAYWFEGSGNTLTPVGPGGAIQVHEPVIVDDTTDPALRGWRLPSVDDLKEIFKPKDQKP